MDIKLRNSVSDAIVEHVRKVGIDEIVDELLSEIESQNLISNEIREDRKRCSKKETDVLDRLELISQIKRSILFKILSILTDKGVEVYDNGKFNLIEKQ